MGEGLYYVPSEATETRSGDGCPAAHRAGAARCLTTAKAVRAIFIFIGPHPVVASIGVSPREAEQGLPAAKLWDATFGGSNRTSRSAGLVPNAGGRIPATPGNPAPHLVRHGIAGADTGAFCFGDFYLSKQIKMTRASARHQSPTQPAFKILAAKTNRSSQKNSRV